MQIQRKCENCAKCSLEGDCQNPASNSKSITDIGTSAASNDVRLDVLEHLVATMLEGCST